MCIRDSIYSAADVFVNLSVIDNLPTVNMEAIACGTPVICYNKSGGGSELIEEGITAVSYTHLLF